MDWIIALDRSIIFAVQDTVVTPWLTPFMEMVSFIGEYGFVWIIIGLGLCYTKKYRRTGMALLLGLIIMMLLGNIVIKNLVMRARPCVDYIGVSVLAVPPDTYSFPSGHSFSSFTAAAIITTAHKKLWSVLAFGLAFIIAFSRIYLFVHYPSDVFAGLVFGLLLGFVSWKIINMRV